MIPIIGLLLLGVCVIYCYVNLAIAISKLEKSLRSQLDHLSENLVELKNRLDDQKLTLDELEYRTLSHSEKEDRVFEHALVLTLSHLRQMKKGETLRLICKSYCYPSHEADFDRFEYQHEHVDETNLSKSGHEVHGFRRFSSEDEWVPYEFLARDDGATSTNAGTIKRLRY